MPHGIDQRRTLCARPSQNNQNNKIRNTQSVAINQITNDNSQWFYVGGPRADKQIGPVTLQEMLNKAHARAITEETLVWKAGMVAWSNAEDVYEIQQVFHREGKEHDPPPPPPKRALVRSPTARKAPIRCLESQRQATRSSGWIEKHTGDGLTYFYNTGSEEVSWDKPCELKSQQELSLQSTSLIWVPHETKVWEAARLISTNPDGSFECESISTGRRMVLPKGTHTTQVDSLNTNHDDLVMQNTLCEAQVLYALRDRYQQNKIYSWVGQNRKVLISINPFKELALYTPQMIETHKNTLPNHLVPPHVFAVANDAYQKLLLEAQPQSILISGESGAGKTEATKQCLHFLADVAGSESGVEQRVLLSNPLLEAFGNAKTVRNNHSSRFGKLIEILFDSETRHELVAAKIHNYLLERPRVVTQQAGERNYHIFYQLCAHAETKKTYKLENPEKFRYISRHGFDKGPEKSDIEAFEGLTAAMNKLDFTDLEKDWLFRMVSGVLHLGNLDFLETETGSNIANTESLTIAASYFGVDISDFEQALCNRSISVRGEKSIIPLCPQKACGGRDALARTIYGNMFDWLVERLNISMGLRKSAKTPTNTKKVIAILDIFGFEIFEKNSFEQLLINFANEKLQQHFNRETFKEEEEIYRLQGIDFKHVSFFDNQPVLDLIERKRLGLLPLLDEEVKLPKGSNENYRRKVQDKLSSLDIFKMDRGKFVFTIEHFAGTVEYTGECFLDKNRDSLSTDLYDLCSTSKDTFTRQIFPKLTESSSSKMTVSQQFQKQLGDLMTTLYTTQPRYIRCIKPNDDKKPNHFDSVLCTHQLRCCGVLEAVEIRKSGYPFRLTHAKFAARYGCINHHRGNYKGHNVGWFRYKSDMYKSPISFCKELLLASKQEFKNLEIGTTMVLYRAEEHRILELLRNLSLETIVPLCQRIVRGFLARSFLRKVRLTEEKLIKALEKGDDLHCLDDAIKASARMVGSARLVFDFDSVNLRRAKELRFKLQEWVDVTDLLLELSKKDTDVIFLELEAAVKRGQQLIDFPHTPEQKACLQQAIETLDHCTVARIDPGLDGALYTLDREKMELLTAKASEIGFRSNLVEEATRLLSLDEEKFVKLQLQKAVELNDPARRIHREVRLKEIFLEANAAQFALKRYPRLRDPYDYALSRLFRISFYKEGVALKMLRWTNRPIHTSLVDYPKSTKDTVSLVKRAKMIFKAILGYMGDRKYPYTDALACDVLTAGLEEPRLRAEIFIQLMKQLTENPSQDSQAKGWDLLGLCAMTLPLPDDIEFYLSLWLQQNAPAKGQKYFSAIHALQYGSNTSREKPTLRDVPLMRQEFAAITHSDFSVLKDTGPTVKVSERGSMKENKAHNESVCDEDRKSTAKNRLFPQVDDERADAAVVLYSFEAIQPGQLSIRPNDKVWILGKHEDWWLAQSFDQLSEGWVPRTYVKLIE